MSIKRLSKELLSFDHDPRILHVAPVDENIFQWRIVLALPQETLLEGGPFTVDFTFPPDYPFRPPRIKFCEPRPFHPIISHISGAVELDFLTMDRWSPALTAERVLHVILRSMAETVFGSYIECHLNGTAMASIMSDAESAALMSRNDKWETHPMRDETLR